MSVRLHIGDCRDVLRSLPAGSAQTCVTSPPYFGLRDYGVAGQIGLEPTPDAFVAEMVAVFREVRRVLADDGTVFLNLGDSYMSSGPRQTGRNDTNRATPGGRGGSFRGGARRAIACDTSGKEPEGSPARGCLCGSLCDACRRAYRTGRSHSDTPHVPTLAASTRGSSLGHKGLPSGHSPTSGSTAQADHSEVSIRGPAPSEYPGAEQPPGAPASTMHGSSLLPPEGSHQSGQPLECQLCGCSLPDFAPASVHTEACNCGTSGLASGFDTSGRGALGLAYPHLTTASLKPKDLIGIPWRVAFALQADGWYLRSDIIWHKPNPMPESVMDRPTSAHEHVFLLAKSQRYFYDAEAVKEAAREGARRFNGGHDVGKDRQDNGRQDASAIADRNLRNVWTVATQPFLGAHFATFPPALIEPCIKAGSRPGDTVLDPFGGAGTTGLVADRLGRNAVLIELNPEYAALAKGRITDDAPLFAEV